MQMQHRTPRLRDFRRCHLQAGYAVQFAAFNPNIGWRRELGAQESIVGGALAWMTLCDVFLADSPPPQIESTLTFRPGHLLALLGRAQSDHVGHRLVHRSKGIVAPSELPGCEGKWIDALGALPATISGPHRSLIRFVSHLHGEARASLDACGARLAAPLVLHEGLLNIVTVPGHGCSEGPGVFHRLTSALREIGNHRVGGVTKERDPSVRPAFDRIAVVHSGDEGGVDGLQESANRRFGSLEGRQQLLGIARVGPRLPLHLSGGGGSQHTVEVLTHPVGDNASLNAEPVVSGDREVEAFKPIARNEGTPHQDVRELLLLGPDDKVAHDRVDTVGADDSIASDLLPRRQSDASARFVLFDADDLCRQLQTLGRKRIAKNPDQVGPVHVVHDRAVLLRHLLAQGRQVEQLTRIEVSVVIPLGYRRHGGQRRLQAEFAHNYRPVGRDLHTRADLGEIIRALEHVDIDAVMAQRDRGGETADTSADDDDLHTGSFRSRMFIHVDARISLRQTSRISSASGESSGHARDNTIAPTEWASMSIIVVRAARPSASPSVSPWEATWRAVSRFSIPASNSFRMSPG